VVRPVQRKTRRCAGTHSGTRRTAGALRAFASGVAVGGGAVGALAIGSVAIRRGAIGKLVVRELKVGELTVERLTILAREDRADPAA
jgi:hypothetical protein